MEFGPLWSRLITWHWNRPKSTGTQFHPKVRKNPKNPKKSKNLKKTQKITLSLRQVGGSNPPGAHFYRVQKACFWHRSNFTFFRFFFFVIAQILHFFRHRSDFTFQVIIISRDHNGPNSIKLARMTIFVENCHSGKFYGIRPVMVASYHLTLKSTGTQKSRKIQKIPKNRKHQKNLKK